MKHNPTLVLYSIGIVLGIAGLNYFGLTITKYASAAQRSTVDSSRIVFVWIFFLLSTGPAQEKFKLPQLIGFIMLLMGTLLHNEIITIPYFGLDRYTRKEVTKKADYEPIE